ncbi:MAG: outer membrane lipoprotein-sorting protein [Desulfobacteraceae bacterium]|jgi:hypothetical protein
MVPKIFLTLSLIFATLVWAPGARAQTGVEIMTEVDRVARESSSSVLQEVKLISCKYGKKDGKTVCTERPRTKRIESVQLDAGDRQEDSKTVSFILEPIGEKGMAMLSYEFDAQDKDNVSWLYLPAMGKVKKIISSDPDDDSGSSFFGSEFFLEDLENIDVDDYTYPHIEEGQYQGRPVWIIEAVPVPAHLRKTRYGKSKLWIDRERHILLMSQLYDKRLKPYKQITMSRIEQIDGVWTPRRTIVKNLVSKRMSVMMVTSVCFNVNVSPQFLTQRALIDFAYRERELAGLRKHLQGK